MRSNWLQACAFALSLAGCATVPSLDATPDQVADRIASDAVAYNQAYGRAIADQVLLNVMRARDRLPLYHLSMSGIAQESQIVGASSFQLGSIGFGHNGATPWGEGQLGQSWETTIKPGYTLNPFSSNGDSTNAFQFRRVDSRVFQHFWENGWPREILLYTIVDSITVDAAEHAVGNSGGRYDARCQATHTSEGDDPRLRPQCAFIRLVETISDSSATPTMIHHRCTSQGPPTKSGRRGEEDASASRDGQQPGDAQPVRTTQRRGEPRGEEEEEETEDEEQENFCSLTLTLGGHAYTLNLRSIDDMIYYVGSLLRGYDEGEEMISHVRVRPTGVYPHDEDAWGRVARDAYLFRVSPPERGHGPGYYAAHVRYRGAHYVAGPANSSNCVLTAPDENAPPSPPSNTECGLTEDELDSSSRVLSLLTQLVIISQSEEAQLAPRNIVTD